MSTAPWAETATKVVIEFKKSSTGCKRRVELTRTRQQGIPNQLAGRVDPKTYDALLAECERLALEHPYLAPATCDCCCANFLALFAFVVVGFGCFQGDAGDYDIWIQKVQQSLAAQSPNFPGCTLSVKSVHGSFWVQIDVTGAPAAQQYQGAAPGYDKAYAAQPMQPMAAGYQPGQQQPYQQQPYQQQPYQQQPYQQQPYQQQPYQQPGQQQPYQQPGQQQLYGKPAY